MRKRTFIIALIALLSSSISVDRQQAESISQLKGLLASTPAPVLAGASIATAVPLVGAPVDSVFALRGGGATDFWHYSISDDQWTKLADTPAPVGEGSGIVQVHSFTFCPPGRYYLAALRGGNTRAFWQFNIEQNRWCVGPSTPAPVGPGGAIAQTQRIGKIFALRGNGTTDFWGFDDGAWTKLANTPGPVNAGGGLIGINYGTGSQRDILYALQGGGSMAVWMYDIDTDTWSHQSDAPTPVGEGGAITSPNFGVEGTLNVLLGGESSEVWSLDIASNSWTLIYNLPASVTKGGAMSHQFNGCNFVFVGEGSTQFFSTGLRNCVVELPDFSMSFDQPVVTIVRGKKARINLNIARAAGFTGSVSIAPPTTLPKGIKIPKGMTLVTGDSLAFKIKAKRGAAAETHSMTFIGKDEAGIVRTATLSLTVQ